MMQVKTKTAHEIGKTHDVLIIWFFHRRSNLWHI